jgi:hypothetical protein
VYGEKQWSLIQTAETIGIYLVVLRQTEHGLTYSVYVYAYMYVCIMDVCMYMCAMYACIHVCMCAYVCMYARLHVCMCMCIVCMCMCIVYVCMRMYVPYVCVNVYVFTCVRVHVYMFVYTQI